jgi:hypothetical protein
MNSTSEGLRPAVGLHAEWAFRGRRSACTPNEFGLQGPSANGRPAPTGRRSLLRRRRPTPGAERLRGRFQSARGAFGRRSACAPNEFGLQGPSANGRPAPTGKSSFASAEADAWRGAPERPIQSIGVKGLQGPAGRPAPTGKIPFASAEADAWRGAPERPISIGVRGLRPAVGLHAE